MAELFERNPPSREISSFLRRNMHDYLSQTESTATMHSISRFHHEVETAVGMLEKKYIPANLVWDISVRFLSWECWNFWRRHDHFRRFPKKSEVFRRRPKSSEDVRSLPKASSLPVPFTSKIRDREEGILPFIYFTHGFRSLNVKQDGNNSHFSIRREKLARRREPAWDRSFQPAGVRLTPKAWELAGIKICGSIEEQRDSTTCWDPKNGY